MSEPVLSISNMDNGSAVNAIISCAKDFFASIQLQDIPNLLKSILDNLKSVGKYIIDKVTDFILNDFWRVIVDTKNIIVYIISQQFDQALACAQRVLVSLEKVLDLLSYIPCLSVAVGVILMVIYLCQLDFAQVALSAICMVGPLKILMKIFPKSGALIKKLTSFLTDFASRFKTQTSTSLQSLWKKSAAVVSARQKKIVNIQYGEFLRTKNGHYERNVVLCKNGTDGYVPYNQGGSDRYVIIEGQRIDREMLKDMSIFDIDKAQSQSGDKVVNLNAHSQQKPKIKKSEDKKPEEKNPFKKLDSGNSPETQMEGQNLINKNITSHGLLSYTLDWKMRSNLLNKGSY